MFRFFIIFVVATIISYFQTLMNFYKKLATVSLIAASTAFTSQVSAQVFIDWDNPQTETVDSLDSLDVYVDDIVIPEYVYRMPMVFTHVQQLDTVSPLNQKFSDNPALQWVEKEVYKINNIKKLRQNVFTTYPQVVRYNIATLPDAPKQYIAGANTDHAVITVDGVSTELNPDDHEVVTEQKRYNWIKKFNGNVQFSQAYNSPNWYQGGNSHLNLLINALYNVKLNPTFYPDLLFETTFQYKLAINSTPDDSLRKYNISEDLFQVNSKFGIRASKKWFYTLTLQAKTQFLNNFKPNTNNMTASFLSPGELTLGLGMTFNHENAKKTISFSASISPASWNLRTCINPRMDPTEFDIPAGKKYTNQIGSSGEATLTWKIAYNINLSSRLFVFTDYKYLQGDWENTLNFTINKYLTTTLYVHLRYDSSTPRMADTQWHRWQLREVLSFGFSYTFATV